MRTIGIIGAGDMGSGVAAAFVRAGFRVVGDLAGRSAHSRALAAQAGLEDVGSLARVLTESELVLSIVPPAVAGDVARDVLAATSIPALTPFADCNAIAPATVLELARAFAGMRPFVDVGIVGRPPAKEGDVGTRFYVSGPERHRVLALEVPGIRMIDLGEAVGRASAIKMVYASLNKGVDALLTAVLLAAERLDVRGELMTELERSQRRLLERMESRVPYLAATAARFAPEMREIAKTYRDAGLTGQFHEGAAWIYTQLARSSLACETRATLPDARSLDEAIAAFAAALTQTTSK
jgi:3-hydroxyisobutyrate dehydrogenase-like beta-hydroxyacid dehydrogenase